MSSWLPLNKTFKDSLPESNPNKDTPVRMFHGDRDPVVRYEAGDASQQKLKELGYDVAFNTYRSVNFACVKIFKLMCIIGAWNIHHVWMSSTT